MDGGGIENIERELLAARIKELEAKMKLVQEANSRMHKDIALERQQRAKANQRMTQLSAQLTVELDQDSAREENPDGKPD